MEAQCARFEAGQVYLPKEASWLAEFLRELLAFPHSRHDDQIDSVSQFLQWAETRRGARPMVSMLAQGLLRLIAANPLTKRGLTSR